MMSKLVKVEKPKFFEDLEEVNNVFYEFIETDRIQNKLIENKIICDKKDVGFTIDACEFRNITFENCEFKNVDMIDIRFINCNLSNMSLRGGIIHRAEFINCKLVGTEFIECNFKDVLFNEVLGRYANFSFSKRKNFI